MLHLMEAMMMAIGETEALVKVVINIEITMVMMMVAVETVAVVTGIVKSLQNLNM